MQNRYRQRVFLRQSHISYPRFPLRGRHRKLPYPHAATRAEASRARLFLGSYLNRKQTHPLPEECRRLRRVTARVPQSSARHPKAQKACQCVTSFLYVKPLAAKGPRRGTSGYMYAKPSSKGVNILLGIEWGQSCALGDLTPATEGHERTRRQ